MSLSFTYAGIVEVNQDPFKLGRLKVRVPHVYGAAATGIGYIGNNELPWALPAGMPAGGSALSGGLSHLPERGDKVWVRFLDGEPEKPIWEWGMQSVDDAKALKLHSYALGTPVGSPNRALWTRYSHAIELNEGSVICTTSQGYRIVLTDASEPGAFDGNIQITTPKGNSCTFDDLDDTVKMLVVEDLYFNVGNAVLGISDSYRWKTMTGDFEIDSGAALTITALDTISVTTASNLSVDILEDAIVKAGTDITVGFAHLSLGLAATQAAVLGGALTLWMESLFLWLATHTHTSATPGTPTSPAQQPTITIQPLPQALLSTTVTIQD
jgi:hypothetical protein